MSARSQGDGQAWSLRKSLRSPGPGYPLSASQLESWFAVAAKAPSLGSRAAPFAPKFHTVCRQLFCSRKFAPATPGMRALSDELHDCWTSRCGRDGGERERTFCPGRAKPAGWLRQSFWVGGRLCRRGFCTWRGGQSVTGTLFESHFCQSLICKPVGVGFPTRAFSWWGGDEGGEETQKPGGSAVWVAPSGFFYTPRPCPATPPPSRTWGTMLVVWNWVLEQR